MPTSLFIEHRDDGLAFYINGDLQFDTADEALYHEYLVVPTIAVAVRRFPDAGLRVLICGGGDGLAARDVLRFPEVCQVNLADYDPEVIELANTVFKPYNRGSLGCDRVSVCIEEAFKFVSTIPDNSYHAVICDFTYPISPEDTNIYSREWFQQVSRVLIPGGIVSTNGVSPKNRTAGFWCLYQTLLSAGLAGKPLQLKIPSFQRQGMENWGFFVASSLPINREEIEDLVFPESLRALTHESLLEAFKFPEKLANIREDVTIHSLACPQLLYYLLNPNCEWLESDKLVNFLDIQEVGTALLGSRDRLQLESIVQSWLEQTSNFQSSAKNINIGELLPVQHRYHSPKMTKEWLTYLRQVLAEIDISQLLNKILERSQELPPKIASEFRELADQIKTGQTLSNLPPHTAEFVMMLSATLLMANLVTPDAIFAKGFYSGSGVNSSSTSYVENDYSMNKPIGWILIVIGGWWLATLFSNSDNE